MRITAAGNVGIGTTSPSSKLEVSSANNIVTSTGTAGFGAFYAKGSGTNSSYLFMGNVTSGEQGRITTLDGSIITFSNTSSATERMRIDSSGNVGIGTSSPTAKLDVLTSINLGQNFLNVGYDVGSGGGWIAGYNSTYSTSAIRTVTTGALSSIWYNSAGLLFYTNSSAAGGTAATERMRIDSSGNVGIGTTSPTQKLEVSSTAPTIKVTATSGQAIFLAQASGTNASYLIFNSGGTETARLTAFSGGVLGFGYGASATEAMRIDSSGNLLVGTTSASNSPTQGITLSPNATVGNLGIGHALGTTTGNTYAQFAYNGTAIGTITQSGTTAVLYNVTSDQRLKTNIIDAPSALSIIDAIQIRSFDWKADNSHNRYGVIAQELNQLVPEAVHTPIAENDMMGVDYSKLVPILIKSFQELKSEFDAYKTAHP